MLADVSITRPVGMRNHVRLKCYDAILCLMKLLAGIM